jgi:hypothetical protein
MTGAKILTTDDVWMKRNTPSVDDVLKRQNAQANADHRTNLPASTNVDDAINDYLSSDHVGGVHGTSIKFTKGKFTTRDGDEIEEGRKLVVVHDGIHVGFIKFNGPGAPPDTRMVLIFKGQRPPPRDSLGDMDEAAPIPTHT